MKGGATTSLTQGDTKYAFADQADVVTHARLAADVLGATKMDRPEWGGVNPLNGEAYMTLTNNSNRVAVSATPSGNQLKPDAANPRYYEDAHTNNDGSIKTNKGNPNGHIIRWRESGGSVAATAFDWDIYLFAAEAGAPADVNLSGLTAVNEVFPGPHGYSMADTSMYDEESTERHFESLRTLLGSSLAGR